MPDSNKVALVTGSSRGIGRAIARQLADMSYFVIGTATTPEGALNVTQDLTKRDGKGVGMVLDLSAPASITQLLEQIKVEYDAPAVLVNNAGITRDNLIMRMKPEEWGDVIDVNLTAVYRLTRSLVRGMVKARWGRIISISSVIARMGNSGQSNYAAAKAGLEGFTRALAIELGSRNITVNAVAPGFIDTDMTARLTSEQREMILQLIPAKRFGRAEEVGSLVGFLSSDAASYITGETVHLNGGMRME